MDNDTIIFSGKKFPLILGPTLFRRHSNSLVSLLLDKLTGKDNPNRLAVVIVGFCS
jgi:hypothetical protein